MCFEGNESNFYCALEKNFDKLFYTYENIKRIKIFIAGDLRVGGFGNFLGFGMNYRKIMATFTDFTVSLINFCKLC